jgi:hypothetical protein
VSRDRCGLYAQGIRRGAPSARQVADRFHLMQNLRENIEREMTSVSRCAGRPRLPAVAGDRHEVVRRQSRLSRQALFVNAKRMHAAGRTFGDIAVEIGADRRTIAKWVSLDDLPDRQRSAIKPSSPLYFQEFLERRWAAGDRSGRRALSHEPFLLVITHICANARFHDSNILADRSRAVRPPLLARCDNAGQSPRAKSPTQGERARAPAGEKARRRTLDTDGALNVPLRQKEGGFKPPPRLRGRRYYAAPWPRIRVRLFNRIRRRARMSACPTCRRSSPRQRSSPAPGDHCLPL